MSDARMDKPIYPTFEARVSNPDPAGMPRLTLTTYLPREVYEHYDRAHVVVGELLGKAKELTDG